MNWLATLCAVVLLAGCATQLDGAAGRLASARKYAEAKNYDEAIDTIRPDIWSPDKSGEQPGRGNRVKHIFSQFRMII